MGVDRQPAVILGLYGENALGVARSLGQEGILAVGFHVGERFPHASYSRYVQESFHAPSEDALLERLIAYGSRANAPPVVFCTGDEFALFAQRHADVLGRYYKLPLSRRDSLEVLIDKQHMLGLAAEAGFLVPRHASLSSDEAYDLPFPVFLKPRYSVGHSKKDMHLVSSLENLKARREPLLASYGDMEVESFIPGPVENQLEIHTYLDSAHGPLIAAMLDFPPVTYHIEGVDAMLSPLKVGGWHEELVVPARRLTELLGFSGAIDMNLKRSDADGKYYLYEYNLRTSANLMHDTAFGLNLPAIIYADAYGLPRDGLVSRERVLGRYWLSDRTVGHALEQGTLSLEEFGRIEPLSVRSVYDPQDSRPFLAAAFSGNLLLRFGQ